MPFSHLLLLGAVIGSFLWQATKTTCETSPLVRSTPPPDPNADPFVMAPTIHRPACQPAQNMRSALIYHGGQAKNIADHNSES